FAATRRDVNDAGALDLANDVPGHPAMDFLRRLAWAPFLFHHPIGDLRGIARGMLLRFQFVERSVVAPADQVLPRQFAQNFVSPLLLEYLLNRLQLRHSFAP